MEVFQDLARAAYTVTDWLATEAIQAATSPNPDGWSDTDISIASILAALIIAAFAVAVIVIPKWRRDLAEQRPTQQYDTSQRASDRERAS